MCGISWADMREASASVEGESGMSGSGEEEEGATGMKALNALKESAMCRVEGAISTHSLQSGESANSGEVKLRDFVVEFEILYGRSSIVISACCENAGDVWEKDSGLIMRSPREGCASVLKIDFEL